MQVYQFIYTDSIYESAMYTVSLHKTKAGAYKAMRDFLLKDYNEWREFEIRYGKSCWKHGSHCAWRIAPIELKD
jgi:hypothetical protein